MIRKLWQRLVVWYGLQYNRWPPWWYNASDVTWTSVTRDALIVDYDHLEPPIARHGGDITILTGVGDLTWTTATIAPNGGDITICPEAFDE